MIFEVDNGASKLNGKAAKGAFAIADAGGDDNGAVLSGMDEGLFFGVVGGGFEGDFAGPGGAFYTWLKLELSAGDLDLVKVGFVE